MINYIFKGNVPNEEVIDFYRVNQPDCFITTSESEGLPVSIMEAMGNGIPIIATDVGGISEMVKDNGILLPHNPTSEQVADAIVRMVEMDEDTELKMRKASRDIWEDKFNSKKNALEFAQYISALADQGNVVKTVILITNGYPYGGEQSFIEPELRELIRHFDIVLVSPVSDEIYEKNKAIADEYIKRVMDLQSQELHNLQVIRVDSQWNLRRGFPYFFTYFCDASIKKERRKLCENKGRIMISLWESIKYYAKAKLFYRDALKKLLENIDGKANVVVYTYWHLPYTLSACLCKHKYSNLKILTREHGFDLYDERQEKSNRQPFREVMDDILEGIAFVCDYGKNYYLNRNALQNNDKKYFVSYLGTEYIESADESDRTDVFRIVSCSHVIPLKRIDKIVDGIKFAESKVNKNIEWIHFGDGFLMEEIKEYAKSVLMDS